MGLQVNNLVVENTLSASTLTATTLFVGTNSVAGDGSSFNSLSSTTLSGGTIYSGSTDLYDIFITINDGNDITRVQPGSNITTGGTGNNPIVNLVNSPSVNNITYSGTSTGGNSVATNVSATTFYSAGTNIETIIYNIASNTEDITRVQPGSNIITGGTANAPTINLVTSPSINGLSVSGTGNFTGTLQSGGTDLNSIYVQGAGTTNIIPLWNGTKLLGNSKITEINSGITVNGSVNILGDVNILGTATTINTQTLQTKDNNVILNFSGTYTSAIGGGITVLSGQPSGVASVWGTDLNGAWSANTQIIATNGLNVFGGTLQSGGTNLYNIFAQPSQVVNNINAGSNIVTGGTSTSPTINLNASPSINGLTISGTGTASIFSALTLSATTAIIPSSGLIIRNPANTFNNTIASSAIVANRTFTLPLLTGNDTFVTAAFTQTLTNKTVNATNNTVTDTSTVLGDLFKSNGTKFVRFAKGTTLQHLRVNSGATDLEWVDEDVTRVQPGSNITTGGTGTSPIVSIVASPSFNNLSFSGTATGGVLSATSITATTINSTTFSGGTFYGNGSGLTGVVIPSSSKGYAEMFMTNNATVTVVSSSGVPYKLAGATSAGALNMFVMSGDNRLQYTGSTTGFSFSVSVNLSAVAASSNQLFQVEIQKNGTIQTNTIMQTQFGSVDQAIGLSGIVAMNPGDYVEVWVQNNTSNKNFTGKYLSFILSQV